MADPNEEPTVKAPFTPRIPRPPNRQDERTFHSDSPLRAKVPVLTAVLAAGVAVLFGVLLTATALRNSPVTPSRQPQSVTAAGELRHPGEQSPQASAEKPVPEGSVTATVEEKTPEEEEPDNVPEPGRKRLPPADRTPEPGEEAPAVVIRIPESTRRDYERLITLGDDIDREWRRAQKDAEREWKRHRKHKDRDDKKRDEKDRDKHKEE